MASGLPGFQWCQVKLFEVQLVIQRLHGQGSDEGGQAAFPQLIFSSTFENPSRGKQQSHSSQKNRRIEGVGGCFLDVCLLLLLFKVVLVWFGLFS